MVEARETYAVVARSDPATRAFVITSPALPGVVIQLDGHGAERLAMTTGRCCVLTTHSPQLYSFR